MNYVFVFTVLFLSSFAAFAPRDDDGDDRRHASVAPKIGAVGGESSGGVACARTMAETEYRRLVDLLNRAEGARPESKESWKCFVRLLNLNREYTAGYESKWKAFVGFLNSAAGESSHDISHGTSQSTWENFVAFVKPQDGESSKEQWENFVGSLGLKAQVESGLIWDMFDKFFNPENADRPGSKELWQRLVAPLDKVAAQQTDLTWRSFVAFFHPGADESGQQNQLWKRFVQRFEPKAAESPELNVLWEAFVAFFNPAAAGNLDSIWEKFVACFNPKAAGSSEQQDALKKFVGALKEKGSVHALSEMLWDWFLKRIQEESAQQKAKSHKETIKETLFSAALLNRAAEWSVLTANFRSIPSAEDMARVFSTVSNLCHFFLKQQSPAQVFMNSVCSVGGAFEKNISVRMRDFWSQSYNRVMSILIHLITAKGQFSIERRTYSLYANNVSVEIPVVRYCLEGDEEEVANINTLLDWGVEGFLRGGLSPVVVAGWQKKIVTGVEELPEAGLPVSILREDFQLRCVPFYCLLSEVYKGVLNLLGEQVLDLSTADKVAEAFHNGILKVKLGPDPIKP